MSNIIGASYVKEGKDSLNLTADDLFDKIINLKFIRKNGGNFSVRSDYEPVHHKDRTITFKKCTQKPDIKIAYKQVAESVAIEVDIRVVNLCVIDGNTKSMYSASEDPVQWCVIQMGYRAQFPNWADPEHRGNIAQFYDLNNHAISSDAEVRRGNQILVQILTGYTESYPPDKVTYFKGIIGSIETGLRWDHSTAELVQGYGDPEFPQHFSEIEEYLFQFVTRRFIRPSVLHILNTVQNTDNLDVINENAADAREQSVSIFQAEQYEKGSGVAAARAISASNEGVAVSSGEWKELLLTENGIMSVEDANRFGVTCIISKTLRSMPANTLYSYKLTPEMAAALPPIPPTPYNAMYDIIGAQLNSLQQHFWFLRWYILMDGSYYFYHVSDTDKDLWSDPFIKRLQKDKTVFLPAIYDMIPSGTRTIRCPFISFLSPMMTVLFQSGFTIGTLVSYFYPPKTNAFLVITSNVAFATVQEDNMMELMCIDLPPQEVVYDPETKEVKVKDDNPPDETPKVARMQRGRNMRWTENLMTVVEHRRGALDTESRWENIVYNDVLASIQPDRWPEGTEPTEKMALEALREWNPEYFDPDGEYMARSDSEYGESIENNYDQIGGRTGIKVSWLLIGDKIKVRHPFQSDYPLSEKVVV